MKDMTQVIKQRLEYHFRNIDGSWNIPPGMPFMAEFLREVESLVSRSEAAVHLLAVAKCPNCDGKGIIVTQCDEDEYSTEPCEWCDTKAKLLNNNNESTTI